MDARNNIVTTVIAAAGFVGCCFGLLIVAFNFWAIHANGQYAKQGVDRHVSLVPLVGPIITTIGLLPLQHAFGIPKWTTLVPWSIDPGTWITLWALVYWPWLARRGAKRTQTRESSENQE